MEHAHQFIQVIIDKYKTPTGKKATKKNKKIIFLVNKLQKT